jgi:hypothetical protein
MGAAPGLAALPPADPGAFNVRHLLFR